MAVLAWVACIPTAWALPTFDEVRTDFRPSDTVMLSTEGEVLQRLRTDATVRRGQWVPLADVSPALRTALVLSEDKRFYEHSGVDWRAASAAAWGNLWNQRTRGASTITMQLAGLLDGDWRQGPGGRSAVQKIGQTVAAQVLDRRWRKDQILEAYLNLVPFRGEVVGIDALSRTLFGKAAHGLQDREAAVAAALVRAPNAKPALVAQRACGVLRAMQQPKAAVDCDALELFTTAAVQRRAFDATEGAAPHFARYALRQQAEAAASSPAAPSAASAGAPPLRTTLRTTLRAPLQRFATQTLQQHLRELRGRNVEDGAVLVLDNATGAVLAWVGSSGQLSQASEVDAVLALRQPGSTLKPFLYGQAIAERRLTAASLVEDSPAQITTSSGLYIPQNYDRQFKGWVSVRTALAASLNVPAVRTLVMVTPDAFPGQGAGHQGQEGPVPLGGQRPRHRQRPRRRLYQAAVRRQPRGARPRQDSGRWHGRYPRGRHDRRDRPGHRDGRRRGGHRQDHPPASHAGREHRHGGGDCPRQLHGCAACAQVSPQPSYPAKARTGDGSGLVLCVPEQSPQNTVHL